MADVFISYKREDRPRVELLAALLTDLDLDVWFDAGIDVGESWEARIMAEARGARAIVVCWTPDACVSEWVRREAEIALERDVLAPVLLSACTPPAPFDAHQAAQLADWSSAADDPEIQKLLKRLEELTGDKALAKNARLRAGGQHEEMVALLRKILVERARAKLPPFTYGEVLRTIVETAAAEGVDLGETNQHSLWGALDSIAEQNRRHREPSLGALVVTADDGLPGRGYFQKHVFLEDWRGEFAKLVHRKHLDWVRSYPWSRDP